MVVEALNFLYGYILPLQHFIYMGKSLYFVAVSPTLHCSFVRCQNSTAVKIYELTECLMQCDNTKINTNHAETERPSCMLHEFLHKNIAWGPWVWKSWKTFRGWFIFPICLCPHFLACYPHNILQIEQLHIERKITGETKRNRVI